jgi:hypothetical protein
MNKTIKAGLIGLGVIFLLSIVIAIGTPTQSPATTAAANVQAPSIASSSPNQSYVSYWNMCIEDDSMNDVASRLSGLSANVAGNNYLAAIQEVEAMQTDVSYAQKCLPQLATYTPLAPQLQKANTTTIQALSEWSSSVNIVLADMQNADYGPKVTEDLLPLFTGADNYNKARELIAAWQSENPQ